MNTQPVTATTTSIHSDTQIGVISLTVADLKRSILFYEKILGFHVISRTDDSAALGAEGEAPFLFLNELTGAARKPVRATGLYHFAILVPSRADLGRSLRHLAETQYPLDGYADHLVSEALYLSDPDGNGIEIYRDRRRDEWNWENGQVVMASEMPDLQGIVAAGDAEPRPWTGLSAGTKIGHMHLQIGDIPQAYEFYHNVLGFDVVAEMPSALFVSAGGYHHHIGLNTWNSLRAAPNPSDAAGMRLFSITFADAEARQQVLNRLEAANIPVEQQSDVVVVNDPWSNVIHLTIAAQKTA